MPPVMVAHRPISPQEPFALLVSSSLSILYWSVCAQVSGDAVLRALQAALESAPSALAARPVLEGFDTAIR